MDGKKGYILTVGNFDGVHRGHKCVLQQLLHQGRKRDLRTAVLTFPEHPLKLIAPEKAPARLMSNAMRRSALKDCGVDSVIELPFNRRLQQLTAAEFMQMLSTQYNVRALLLGFNNRIGSDRITDFDEYRRIGRQNSIEVIPVGQTIGAEIEGVNHVSSSAIRRALNEGNVDEAASMLGYDYAITGTVVEGHKIGRTIGFPTANIQTDDPEIQLPADGVYAANAIIQGTNQTYRCVVNIGKRPTVNGSNRTIEAHIIGLDSDIYGKQISLSFTRRLRPEMKFQSLAALKDQIALDIQQALNQLP